MVSLQYILIAHVGGSNPIKSPPVFTPLCTYNFKRHIQKLNFYINSIKNKKIPIQWRVNVWRQYDVLNLDN